MIISEGGNGTAKIIDGTHTGYNSITLIIDKLVNDFFLLFLSTQINNSTHFVRCLSSPFSSPSSTDIQAQDLPTSFRKLPDPFLDSSPALNVSKTQPSMAGN